MKKKHPKKHIYTKQQNQNQPEEIYFILKIQYSSEQKKVDRQSISGQTIGKRKRKDAGDLFQRVAVFI